MPEIGAYGEALIEVQGAWLTLRSEGQDHAVLRGLNFCLHKGQHTAILGANGAGKSTLLRLLRGEAWLDSASPASLASLASHASLARNRESGGSIVWHTNEGAESAPLAGRSITSLVSTAQQEHYVRQGWDLSGEELLLTAFADSPLLYTRPEREQQKAAQNMAKTLCCVGLLSRAVNTLSQGQLRLLLLGRALLRQSPLLLLDEYMDGLDKGTRARVLTVLEKYVAKDPRRTLVITAHREEALPSFVRRRLYLHEGKLWDQPQAGRGALPSAVKASAVMSAQIKGSKAKASPAVPACAQPTISTASTRPSASQACATPPLIDIAHATVFIDRVPVLHDITWAMQEGEHWHIQGTNGAGKSSFLHLLAGDHWPADGGSICRYLPRHGGEVQDLPTLRQGIRLVSDEAQTLYGYDLTGLDLVLSGFDNVVGTYRDYRGEEEHEALGWMRRLHAEKLSSRRIRSLSTGQLRRLFLARALLGSPEILLLDEPCSGLDKSSRAEFLAILEDISALTHLVLVSHHESDAVPALTRVACLEGGYLRVLR